MRRHDLTKKINLPTYILQTCDNWDTDYYSYNWEPEFMTIFVTWQSRVTIPYAIVHCCSNVHLETPTPILTSSFLIWIWSGLPWSFKQWTGSLMEERKTYFRSRFVNCTLSYNFPPGNTWLLSQVRKSVLRVEREKYQKECQYYSVRKISENIRKISENIRKISEGMPVLLGQIFLFEVIVRTFWYSCPNFWMRQKDIVRYFLTRYIWWADILKYFLPRYDIGNI